MCVVVCSVAVSGAGLVSVPAMAGSGPGHSLGTLVSCFLVRTCQQPITAEINAPPHQALLLYIALNIALNLALNILL